MSKLIKRFGLLLLAGLLLAPVTLAAGCHGDVDDDGASLDIGD